MARTFNCGIGMIVVVAAGDADTVSEVLTREGETVTRIGRLAKRDGRAVVYEGALAL